MVHPTRGALEILKYDTVDSPTTWSKAQPLTNRQIAERQSCAPSVFGPCSGFVSSTLENLSFTKPELGITLSKCLKGALNKCSEQLNIIESFL